MAMPLPGAARHGFCSGTWSAAIRVGARRLFPAAGKLKFVPTPCVNFTFGDVRKTASRESMMDCPMAAGRQPIITPPLCQTLRRRQRNPTMLCRRDASRSEKAITATFPTAEGAVIHPLLARPEGLCDL